MVADFDRHSMPNGKNVVVIGGGDHGHGLRAPPFARALSVVFYRRDRANMPACSARSAMR